MKTITLKNLPEATEQEVFDHIANHLLTQNKKSKDGDLCVYFNKENGLKCAAGCLIPEEEYFSEMEGMLWEDLIEEGLVPANHSRLIVDLQNLHDEVETNDWKNHLKTVANNYNLNFNS